MADSAFQTQYRQEMIKGFEKRESYARRTTTTEAEVRGNQAVFLVADSGGATAVTRGINGDIPTRPDNLNQYTATLAEWHDIPERTNFNIFASQGNGRALMQATCMSVINRKIDSDIHTELDNATVTWNSGSVDTADLPAISKAKTILHNNFAAGDAPVFALITPAYFAYMMAIDDFKSRDYISTPKFEGVSNKDMQFSWYGVNWIVDAGLPGTGTASAKCWMYSQNAIGHACDKEGLATFVGYDSKNDKSWARCSTYMGSKLLQTAGVVEMLHDDSAFSA